MKKNSFLFISILIAIAYIISCSDADEAEDIRMYDGRNLFDQGEFDEAAKLFNDVYEQNPNNLLAKLNLANTQSAQGGNDIFELLEKLVDVFSGMDESSGEGSSNPLIQLSTVVKGSVNVSSETISKIENGEIDSLAVFIKDNEKEVLALINLGMSENLLNEFNNVNYAKVRVNIIKGVNYLIRALIFFAVFFDKDSNGEIDAMEAMAKMEKLKKEDNKRLNNEQRISEVATTIDNLAKLLNTFLIDWILDQFTKDLQSSVDSFKTAGVPDKVIDPISEIIEDINSKRSQVSGTLGEGGGGFVKDQLHSMMESKVKDLYGKNVPDQVSEALDNLDETAVTKAAKEAAENVNSNNAPLIFTLSPDYNPTLTMIEVRSLLRPQVR